MVGMRGIKVNIEKSTIFPKQLRLQFHSYRRNFVAFFIAVQGYGSASWGAG